MKVIVTRPRVEADAWVQQLRALHLDAIALPLIQIGALPDSNNAEQAQKNLHQYTAVMFVSSNAVRYFYQSNKPLAGKLFANDAIEKIVNFANKPRIWVTGPGTREALLVQSVPVDMIDAPASDSAQFDSEALWSRVQNQVKHGDKVLIVRGSSADSTDTVMNGRPWLADQLTAVGVQVDVVVSYQRSLPVFDAAQQAMMVQASTDGSVWLLSSSEAVANLKALSGLSLPPLNWSKAKAVATHPRIAQAAKDAGFGVVYESRPTLADVVASIESVL
jgi:uroporphyrinogen-III synthase